MTFSSKCLPWLCSENCLVSPGNTSSTCTQLVLVQRGTNIAPGLCYHQVENLQSHLIVARAKSRWVVTVETTRLTVCSEPAKDIVQIKLNLLLSLTSSQGSYISRGFLGPLLSPRQFSRWEKCALSAHLFHKEVKLDVLRGTACNSPIT